MINDKTRSTILEFKLTIFTDERQLYRDWQFVCSIWGKRCYCLCHMVIAVLQVCGPVAVSKTGVNTVNQLRIFFPMYVIITSCDSESQKLTYTQFYSLLKVYGFLFYCLSFLLLSSASRFGPSCQEYVNLSIVVLGINLVLCYTMCISWFVWHSGSKL